MISEKPPLNVVWNQNKLWVIFGQNKLPSRPDFMPIVKSLAICETTHTHTHHKSIIHLTRVLYSTSSEAVFDIKPDVTCRVWMCTKANEIWELWQSLLKFISHTNSLYICRGTIWNIVQKLYESLLWHFCGAFFDWIFENVSLFETSHRRTPTALEQHESV